MKTTGYKCDRCKEQCNGHGIVINVKETAICVDIIIVPLKDVKEGDQGVGNDKHFCGKGCFMKEMDAIADKLLGIRDEKETTEEKEEISWHA